MLPLLLLAITIGLPQWQPLEAGLEEARRDGRLVLAYVSPGTPKQDDRAAAWIAEAWTRESVSHALEGVVLAQVLYRSPLLRKYEEIRVVARSRDPHFVVLDPGGGVVAEVLMRDPGEFASSLRSLVDQAPVFARSAQLRSEGARATAYLLRGIGLGNAGAREGARTAYQFAAALTKNGEDPVVHQRAELGLAMLDAGSPSFPAQRDAIARLDYITKHALTPQIAAAAWIVIGHSRKDARDPNGATAAYERAFKLASAGSELSETARRFLEMMGASDGAPASSHVRGAGVRLIFQHQPILAGSLDVAAAAPAATSRVEFYLDNARVTESSKAPFSATLQLGSTPRVHTLRAVARDRTGAVLGEDSVTINDHPDRISVRIAEPVSEVVETATTIEVVARVPDGVTLEGVDLFWNEQKLTTLTAPPFRYELKLPRRFAFGYVGAVARDNGGGTAEDVKLINGSAAGEARVDAVEIFAIVHDRNGRVVENLKAEDFIVKEDGARVNVAVRSDPADPITVALALDTSMSMRPTMMNVADYASIFLRQSLQKRDAAMIINFDNEPHLTQRLTEDLQGISTSLFETRAAGGTALWDALAFTLAQLRGIPGKRSLLVFTDGVDNASRTTPDGVIALAREAGVPIYLVLMFSGRSGEAATFGRRSLAFDSVTRGSAGALFRMPKRVDLTTLFEQVRNDTRGQYILSFASKSSKPLNQLRRVSVEVRDKQLTVRAMSGYYPR